MISVQFITFKSIKNYLIKLFSFHFLVILAFQSKYISILLSFDIYDLRLKKNMVVIGRLAPQKAIRGTGIEKLEHYRKNNGFRS